MNGLKVRWNGNECVKEILKVCSGIIKGVDVTPNIIKIKVDKEKVVDLLLYLKNDSKLKFESLMDVWGVDYRTKTGTFEVNYNLLSIRYGFRIIVSLDVKEWENVLSVSKLYNSAYWLEREVWDMYGIFFEGNNDLRRILTDYGFEGFPLRKDFPLSGFLEVRYDEGEKRIVVEPLEMAQEYRNFNFLSPWENRI